MSMFYIVRSETLLDLLSESEQTPAISMLVYVPYCKK